VGPCNASVFVALHVGRGLPPPLDLPRGRAMLSRRSHCQVSFSKVAAVIGQDVTVLN
jgi:hypothetical protein